MGLTKLDTWLILPLSSAYVFGLRSSGSSEEKNERTYYRVSLC